MKKFLLVVLIIVGLFLLVLKIFSNYNSNNIMYNQAGFEIYFDTQELDIDQYFGLPAGTYSSDEHALICKPPVNIQGFKSSTLVVNFDLTSIDCAHSYNPSAIVKYEPYELNGATFDLLLVRKLGVNLNMFSQRLGGKSIVGKRTLRFSNYLGKLNRLIVNKRGLYEYCD